MKSRVPERSKLNNDESERNLKLIDPVFHFMVNFMEVNRFCLFLDNNIEEHRESINLWLAVNRRMALKKLFNKIKTIILGTTLNNIYLGIL